MWKSVPWFWSTPQRGESKREWCSWVLLSPHFCPSACLEVWVCLGRLMCLSCHFTQSCVVQAQWGGFHTSLLTIFPCSSINCSVFLITVWNHFLLNTMVQQFCFWNTIKTAAKQSTIANQWWRQVCAQEPINSSSHFVFTLNRTTPNTGDTFFHIDFI